MTGISDKRCPALPVIVFSLAMVGCSTTAKPEKVPAITFSDMLIDSSFGGSGLRVESKSIDTYITKYGDAGWRRGLLDERRVEDAMPPSSQLLQDKDGAGLLVKDIFYTCYVRVGRADLPAMRESLTREQRNELIARAILRLDIAAKK